MNHCDSQSERPPPPHRPIAFLHQERCYSLTLQSDLSPSFITLYRLSHGFNTGLMSQLIAGFR